MTTERLPPGWTPALNRDTYCHGCGARVIWATFDKTGRRAPFDLTPEGGVSISHFATCPHAALFRRKGTR
jgi:hypothetical protein